jgi:hypothetical protein
MRTKRNVCRWRGVGAGSGGIAAVRWRFQRLKEDRRVARPRLFDKPLSVAERSKRYRQRRKQLGPITFKPAEPVATKPRRASRNPRSTCER